MPKGIQIFFCNCSDPKRHQEFNSWYSHTHLPDLKSALGLRRVRRFTNGQHNSGGFQYLAAYEFESDNLGASVDDLIRLALETVPRGRHIDCLQAGTMGLYREIDPGSYKPLPSVSYPKQAPVPASPMPAPGAQPVAATLPRAQYLVLADCTDPARDEEFNRWYTHTHLTDLKPAKGLVRATRYRREHPDRAPTQYLAIYEFASKDPSADSGQALAASTADFFRLVNLERQQGRRIDCSQVVASHFFLEIDAAAYPPLKKLDYPRDQDFARRRPR